MNEEELQIRNFHPTDESFIFDSWAKSFFEDSPFCKYLTHHEFQQQHIPIIGHLMRRAQIRILSEKASPELIVGYIVFQPYRLHYLYIKEVFRGMGLAKKLIQFHEESLIRGSRVTHLTLHGRKLQKRYGFIYSPYFEVS